MEQEIANTRSEMPTLDQNTGNNEHEKADTNREIVNIDEETSNIDETQMKMSETEAEMADKAAKVADTEVEIVDEADTEVEIVDTDVEIVDTDVEIVDEVVTVGSFQLIFPISILKFCSQLSKDAQFEIKGNYNGDDGCIANIQGSCQDNNIHFNVTGPDDLLCENLTTAIKCQISAHKPTISGSKRSRGRPRKAPIEELPQVTTRVMTRHGHNRRGTIVIETKQSSMEEPGTPRANTRTSRIKSKDSMVKSKVTKLKRGMAHVGVRKRETERKTVDEDSKPSQVKRTKTDVDVECDMEWDDDHSDLADDHDDLADDHNDLADDHNDLADDNDGLDDDQDDDLADDHVQSSESVEKLTIKQEGGEKHAQPMDPQLVTFEDVDVSVLFNMLQCNICSRRLANADSVKEHVVAEHAMTWENYSRANKALLAKQVKLPTLEKKKKPIKIITKREKIGRKSSKKSDIDLKHKCYHCDKRFAHRRGINEHIRLAHASKVEDVTATQPEQASATQAETGGVDRSELYREIAETSTMIAMESGLINDSVDSTACLVCNKVFSGGRWAVRTRLPRHIETQHLVSVDKYRQILVAETVEARQQMIQEVSALEYIRRRQQKLQMLGDHSEFRCIGCDKSYAAYNNLMKHIKQMHMGEKTYQEILLAAEEQGSAAYRPAMKDRHEMDMTCVYCGVKRNGRFLMKHLKNIHGDEATVKQEIQKSTEEHVSRINERERQRKRKGPQIVHSDRLFDCTFCGMQFEQRQARYRHSRFKCPNNANVKRKIWCRCSKGFLTRESLEKHKIKCDLREAIHMCHLCGKVYTNKSGLYTHKQTAHCDEIGGKYKRACEICNKMFYRRQHYERHKPKHSNERTCQCELCGKKFKTREDIRKHQYAMHFNRYTYHCPDCGHGMNKMSYLMNHKCGRVRRQQEHNDVINKSMNDKKNEEVLERKPLLSVHDGLLDNEGLSQANLITENVTIVHNNIVGSLGELSLPRGSHGNISNVINNQHVEIDVHHLVAPQEVVTSEVVRDITRDVRTDNTLDMATYEGLHMLANATGYPIAHPSHSPLMVIAPTSMVTSPASLESMVTTPAGLVTMVTSPATLPTISSVTQALPSHYYTLPTALTEVPISTTQSYSSYQQ